jgi:hypothetical protein
LTGDFHDKLSVHGRTVLLFAGLVLAYVGVHPRRASAPLLGVVGLGVVGFTVAMPTWLVPALFAASMAWLGLAVARRRS